MMGNRLVLTTARFTALALLFTVCVSALAQNQERPKLKHFGSSLKQIKWDEEKQAAVEKKTKSSPRAESGDVDVVKIETSLVSTDVLVLDADSNPVQGLSEKEFLIAEDGRSQQVGMFSLGSDIKVPRSIVLIIDYSGSQFPFIKTSVAAAKTLVDQLPASDSMAIVTDDVELIQDFTKDKQELKSKLDSLLKKVGANTPRDSLDHVLRKHFGRSQQYSALMATLREAFNNEDQRPIVIFQTDGDQLGFLRNSPVSYLPFGVDKRTAAAIRQSSEEYRVNFSLDDIYREAEKARATIYTVVSGERLLGRRVEDMMAEKKKEIEFLLKLIPAPMTPERQRLLINMTTDEQLRASAENAMKYQSALESVATSTGGWAMFLEKPEDADGIYSKIFSDINRRYIVGYYPVNKEHDGKRRKVEITVGNHPEYKVVSRGWYYAPSADQ